MMNIELKHGSGGEETAFLLGRIFTPYFKNKILDRMEDGAVLPSIKGNPVFTTDSFVVQPLFFPGGDIGRLSVCGTVNDLACMGAEPLYLTAGFILEEGLPLDVLEKVAASMADTAKEAGVNIVAGDTKVIGRRERSVSGRDGQTEPGLFINTSGLGVRRTDCAISASAIQPGDKLLVSGYLGDHQGVIMASRLKMKTELQSDCAPLAHMVASLLAKKMNLHALRDLTRGGLATAANELALASGCGLILEEEALPIRPAVRSLCGLLGLEAVNMGNEGKIMLALPPQEAEAALQVLRAEPYGKNACIIGEAVAEPGVFLKTLVGSRRSLPPLRGEGLPRIC